MMKLVGMQKLTLLDFPSVVGCVVFTSGCNFKCPFCHNATLVDGRATDFLSEESVLKFLKSREGILEGLVITGGEPLLHNDIPLFMEKVKKLGYKIKLDTNGTRPTLLKEIVKKGLVDYVAMDIKNSPDEYEKATGDVKLDLEAIEESKSFLLEGHVDYEFRTTVVKGIHTPDGIKALAEWISGADKYFLQQFKNSGELLAPDGLDAFSPQELREFLSVVEPYVKDASIRGI